MIFKIKAELDHVSKFNNVSRDTFAHLCPSVMVSQDGGTRLSLFSELMVLTSYWDIGYIILYKNLFIKYRMY